DGTFVDRAENFGVEPPARGTHLGNKIKDHSAARSSRSAAAFDVDNDGQLDLVVNNFNDQPYLFRNQTPRKNYVAFRLRGARSNRDGIGAVIRVYQGNKVFTRQVTGAAGYLSQSSRTAHFGLGDNATIDRVEIVWPSGVRQRLDGVAANARHDITEPDAPQPKKSAGVQP